MSNIAERNITKRLTVWAGVVAAILLVPFLAMQFNIGILDPGSGYEQVNWTLGDFIFAAILLFGSATVYELVARKARTTIYRAAAGLAVLAALMLVWVNGAVGLIGSEDNPANLLYAGVLAVGLIGAAAARFEAKGMSRTLFAMALAQAIVPVLALIIWQPDVFSTAEHAGIVKVIGINMFFVALFTLAALLFRQASTTQQTQA